MDNCFYSCNYMFYNFFHSQNLLPFFLTIIYICHIIHGTIANFDVVMIEDLVLFTALPKFLSNKCKNCFAILILAFSVNGGLCQMMFLPLFFFSCVYCSFSNVSFSEYQHLSKRCSSIGNLFITRIQ